VSKELIYDVVRFPVVTEKSTSMAEQNKYVFRVSIDSTKAQIKRAIETIFSVSVTKVNTIVTKGKVKRFRGRLGTRNDYKKAVVSIADGQTIDVSVGV
jgi:large subunit ribosomal protein L23